MGSWVMRKQERSEQEDTHFYENRFIVTEEYRGPKEKDYFLFSLQLTHADVILIRIKMTDLKGFLRLETVS